MLMIASKVNYSNYWNQSQSILGNQIPKRFELFCATFACFWFRDWSIPRCKSTELLTGRTVVITGANSGMGKELANVLAMKGVLTTSIILDCITDDKFNEIY